MSAVSNTTPVWLSPLGDNSTDTPNTDTPIIHVSEDHPILDTITTFNVSWSVQDEVVYGLHTVISGEFMAWVLFNKAIFVVS